MKKWLKKVFIPHEGNNHHPHFWKNGSLAVMLLLIAVLEIGVFTQSYVVDKGSYLAAVLPAVVATLVNDQRTANNATVLQDNSLLDEAANLKAQDMATKGYFSHTTPEGYNSWYWLDKVGYQYSHAGENLAVNFTDSQDVVNAWMNSPTHRANIVKQIYTEEGVGMAEGMYQGKDAIFVVQFFGTPGTGAANFPIVATNTFSSTTPSEIATATTSTVTQSTSTPTSTPVAVTQQSVTVKTTETPSGVVTAESSTTDASTTTALAASSTATSSTSTLSIIGPTLVAGAEVDQNVATPGFFQTLLSSPRHLGMYILFVLLAFIVCAYLLYVFGKNKMHHPRIAAAAIFLVLVIGGALALNQIVLRDQIVIGQGSSISLPVATI